MSARSYLNAAFAHLTKESTPEGIKTTRELLNLKFDHEMDAMEARRQEAYRRTLLAGGTGSVQQLAERMMGGQHE